MNMLDSASVRKLRHTCNSLHQPLKSCPFGKFRYINQPHQEGFGKYGSLQLIKCSAHASVDIAEQKGLYLYIYITQPPARQFKETKNNKKSLRVACLNRSKARADFEKSVNWSRRLIPRCVCVSKGVC
jgi:hypothetical protein